MLLRKEIVQQMKLNGLRVTKLVDGKYKQKTVKEMKEELKKLDDDIEIVGGGLKSGEIKQFLQKSYEKENSNMNNYVIDEQLSGQRAKVYYDPISNKTVVVHRGTKDLADWKTNIGMTLGIKTKRFKHAKKIEEQAQKKYGKHISLGHSLGGILAETQSKKGNEVITLNKATLPSQIGKKIKSNQTDIRTTADPVSALNKLQRGKKKRTVTIQSNLINNPLKEHSVDVLNRLDENQFIGKEE